MSIAELERPLSVYEPQEIIEGQPRGPYPEHQQPTYDNQEELLDVTEQLQAKEGVTTIDKIDALQTELTRLARGETSDPIVLEGRCAEELVPQRERSRLVREIVRSVSIVNNGVRRALHIKRAAGQYAKPRSSEMEVIDTVVVDDEEQQISAPSYMGAIVNRKDKTLEARRPDPQLILEAEDQAEYLTAAVDEELDRHVPLAHEALLLVYEKSMIRIDEATGRKYLASTDMPWIGARTNSLEGEHVALLEGLANPIGVKIGASSDADHIRGLQDRLNPDNEDGKLTFMVRIGEHQKEQMQTVIAAIAEHSPNSIVMYDIHGTTKNIGGEKIRAVADIIYDVQQVAKACFDNGIKLHGVHLETNMDDSRRECVERRDQKPTHEGGVDPQLSAKQLEAVLDGVAPYLLHPTQDELDQDENLQSSFKRSYRDPWATAYGVMSRY